jgi:hypothetical protein
MEAVGWEEKEEERRLKRNHTSGNRKGTIKIDRRESSYNLAK